MKKEFDIPTAPARGFGVVRAIFVPRITPQVGAWNGLVKLAAPLF